MEENYAKAHSQASNIADEPDELHSDSDDDVTAAVEQRQDQTFDPSY